jgi:hypothetical protein
MHRTLFLSCGLLLAACGGSSKPAAAPTPTTTETLASRCRALIEKNLSLQPTDPFATVPDPKRAPIRARFVDAMVTSCTEDDWTEELLTCGEKAADAAALDTCSKLMNEERRQKAATRLEPIWKEMAAASSDEPEAPPEPMHAGVVPTDGTTGIAACDEYLVVFETYMACDKVPPAARDASKDSIAAMPRNGAAAGCAQGVEALRQSAEALGCDLEAIAATEAKKAAGATEPANKKPAKKQKAKK